MFKAEEKNRIREACLLLVGKPYVLGAEVDLGKVHPKMKLYDLYQMVRKIDCSELVQTALKYGTGKVFTDLAAAQYEASEEVKASEIATGDLCFLRNNPKQANGIGHVGIYIGGDIVVEAKGRNFGVVISTVKEWKAKPTFAGWRRPII